LRNPRIYSIVFGVIGGIQFSLENLVAFKSSIPPDSTWQTIGVTGNWFPAAMASAITGGYIRCGLEDNIYIDIANKVKAKGG
jgi:3-keto-5-aminohexanoate cleavage enzyme